MASSTTAHRINVKLARQTGLPAEKEITFVAIPPKDYKPKSFHFEISEAFNHAVDAVHKIFPNQLYQDYETGSMQRVTLANFPEDAGAAPVYEKDGWKIYVVN